MNIDLRVDEFQELVKALKDGVTPPPVEAPDPGRVVSFESREHLMVRLSVVFDWLNSGNKINAIKEVRELLGVGLKEAKDTVEGVYRRPVNRF